MKQRKNTQKGFTLIEVAIVVLAGGVLLTASLLLIKNYLQQVEVQATQSRMQAIENAISAFYNINGRLPCVAPLTDQIDSNTFGLEINPPNPPKGPPDADCTIATVSGTFQGKGLPTTQSTITLPAGSPNPIQIGAVPVRSLNLPDQDMMDGWNDRFIYAVTANLASTLEVYDAADGGIGINDSSGNPVALPKGTAQYVLISTGQDRVGAFAGGSQSPCTAGLTETPNCNINPPPSPVTFVKTVLQGTQYDDYVDFFTSLSGNGAVPGGTIMIFDGLVCPAGWDPPPGGPAGNPAGAVPSLNCPSGPSISCPPNALYCEKQ